jgi:hypothetical protein
MINFSVDNSFIFNTILCEINYSSNFYFYLFYSLLFNVVSFQQNIELCHAQVIQLGAYKFQFLQLLKLLLPHNHFLVKYCPFTFSDEATGFVRPGVPIGEASGGGSSTVNNPGGLQQSGTKVGRGRGVPMYR